jgi:hypothetical protein
MLDHRRRWFTGPTPPHVRGAYSSAKESMPGQVAGRLTTGHPEDREDPRVVFAVDQEHSGWPPRCFDVAPAAAACSPSSRAPRVPKSVTGNVEDHPAKHEQHTWLSDWRPLASRPQSVQESTARAASRIPATPVGPATRSPWFHPGVPSSPALGRRGSRSVGPPVRPRRGHS